jgi:hypothetical protein
MVSALFTAFAIIAAGQAEAPPIAGTDSSLPIAYFEGKEEDEDGRPIRRHVPRPRR